MKHKIYNPNLGLLALCFTLGFLFPRTIAAQSVGKGKVEARFGVDGDLAADTALNGGAVAPNPNMKPSDDWFYSTNVKAHQGGLGIIDTTGAFGLKAYMQSSASARQGLVFSRQMAVPKLTRSGNYILLDALYAKDQANSDKTSITNSIKVIDDPSTWKIGAGSPNAKTDILEFYSHVRRKGINVHDSLFFYFGVGIYSSNGNKNVTAELFVNDVKLDTVAGALSGLGSQGGRVAWRFDNAGNVKVIGDMIVELNYVPGGSGTYGIHPRIWMRQSTYDSFKPASVYGLSPVNFDLGVFTSQGGANGYGYADIEPKGTLNVIIGQGSANDVTTLPAAPWGTIGSGSGYPFSTTYSQDQFVEFSANFTALGVDPALFSGIDPCTVPYRSISFYSHTSTSANSSPEDFAGPYPFWRYPRVISDIKGADTLSCTKTSGSIFADSAYSLAWYKWTSPNGNITGYNADSTSITYDKAGSYILESAPLRGCWTRKDTLVILGDYMAPRATAEAYDTLIEGMVFSVNLYGGDSLASVAAVSSPVFGESKGLTWQWFGKNGFISTVQDPLVSDSGYYTLVVTENRNGCTDTANTLLVALPVTWGDLSCNNDEGGARIQWNVYAEYQASRYLVQQWNGNDFQTLTSVPAMGAMQGTTYNVVVQALPADYRIFRIVLVNIDGTMDLGPVCQSIRPETAAEACAVFPNPAETAIHVLVPLSEKVEVYIVNSMGVALYHQEQLNTNRIDLDLQTIPAGIYCVRVDYDGVHYTQWIVKK